MIEYSFNKKKSAMSPRSPAQFEKMRSERETVILQTALELFTDRGYNNTSIAAIAKKAGMATGLLYNYFAGKEELLQVLLHKCMEEMMAPLAPLMDCLDTIDGWQQVVDRLLESLQNNSVQWTLYFSLFLQPSMQGRMPASITEADGHFIAALHRCLDRAGVEDPQTESMLFHFAMIGAMVQHAMNPGFFPLNSVAATLKGHLESFRSKAR
jgi:AcrR family transcriptional regulator